ncbi:MAG: hypothetical protein FJY91_02755 [Candidatus Harrisonbacteria bacterium]|nr:hypothetical protein [Candidatus Harrisonbacteria bacterium]
MKATIFSLFIAILIISGAFYIVGKSEVPSTAANVTIEDGKQVIDLRVKGGYSPKITQAKANIPTTLKLKTNNTFDCSASVVIPDLNYQTFLPSSGATKVELPPQAPGTTLRGLCSMGMFGFTVHFN